MLVHAMHIKFGTMMLLPVDRAFEVVSNPENWSKFLPGMGTARGLQCWGKPVGKAGVVTRVLGRNVPGEIELIEWVRPDRLRYVVHPGHKAHLHDVPAVRRSAAAHPGLHGGDGPAAHPPAGDANQPASAAGAAPPLWSSDT